MTFIQGNVSIPFDVRNRVNFLKLVETMKQLISSYTSTLNVELTFYFWKIFNVFSHKNRKRKQPHKIRRKGVSLKVGFLAENYAG